MRAPGCCAIQTSPTRPPDPGLVPEAVAPTPHRVRVGVEGKPEGVAVIAFPRIHIDQEQHDQANESPGEQPQPLATLAPDDFALDDATIRAFAPVEIVIDLPNTTIAGPAFRCRIARHG